MKVLFICLDRFPKSGACSNLLKNLIIEGELIKHIDEIHVITAHYTKEDPVDEIWLGIHIHRVWIDELVQKKYVSELLKTNFLKGVIAVYNKIIHKLMKRSVFSKSFIDKRVSKKIYDKLCDLQCEEFDIIIPVAGNFDCVFSALQFKKKIKQQINVVVLQVDPCSSNVMYSPRSKQKRQEFEKEFLKEASLVVTLPTIYKDLVGTYLHDSLKKVTVMETPNVITDIKYKYGYVDLRSGPDILTCVFAGQIYKKIRDPLFTLELFSGLGENVQLIMVGVENDQLPDQFKNCGNILCKGVLNIDETRRILNSADILVNIGNNLNNQVPSKLLEYISFGKPIVNVYKVQDCPTLEYMNKYPLSLSIFENPAELYQDITILNTFVHRNRGLSVDEELINTVFLDCTAKKCAEKMFSALSSLPNSR